MDGFEVGPYPDLLAGTFRYLPQHGDPDACNISWNKLERH